MGKGSSSSSSSEESTASTAVEMEEPEKGKVAPAAATHEKNPWKTCVLLGFILALIMLVLVIVFGAQARQISLDNDELKEEKTKLEEDKAQLQLELDELKAQLANTTASVVYVTVNVTKNVTSPNARLPCDNSEPIDLIFPQKVADVFDPFTSAELDQIAQHVRAQLNLASDECVDDNCTDVLLKTNWLWGVDFLPHAKNTSLDALAGGAFPGRLAKAIVYHLADDPPKVIEYKVGPIAFPTTGSATFGAVTPINQSTGGITTEIPVNMRPTSDAEYVCFEGLLTDAMTTLANLSTATWGETYDDGNMWWTDSAPRGYARDTRQSWTWFVWYAEGMYALPLGLNVLMEHKSLECSDWSILEIVYNGQNFSSALALAEAFNSGTLDTFQYPRPAANSDNDPLFSSMRRRQVGKPLHSLQEKPIPVTVNQGGQRFGVNGHQVQWNGWDFHIGYQITSGMYLNDIRFDEERIVYELSLQDAFAAYSGSMPIQALSQYSDGGWGLAVSNYPLMPGVDCPLHAHFLDTDFIMGGGDASSNANSICIWESPDNMASLRHYDVNWAAGEGYASAGAFPRTTLFVRTTSTVYNYDYYLTYAFHGDGTIEVIASASGYLQSEFYPQRSFNQNLEQNYGQRVHNFTMGSLHDHFFGYKVDLDVKGVSNRIQKNTIKAHVTNFPYNFGGNNNWHKYVEKTQITTESLGVSSDFINPNAPASFLVYSNTPEGTNKWGVHRSYTVHVPSSVAQLVPNAPWAPSSQWTKYTVTMTQRKDAEEKSARVLYDMQAPADPLVQFEDYSDGDSLVDQDVVAWVCLGNMHYPSTEDLPVTPTSASSNHFFIKPVNYFEINPAARQARRYFQTPDESPFPSTEVSNVDTTNLPLEERCYDNSLPHVLS